MSRVGAATELVCILQRLQSRWQVVAQRQSSGEIDDDENPESQEVLDDQLTRLLTRDYFELLSKLEF